MGTCFGYILVNLKLIQNKFKFSISKYGHRQNSCIAGFCSYSTGTDCITVVPIIQMSLDCVKTAAYFGFNGSVCNKTTFCTMHVLRSRFARGNTRTQRSDIRCVTKSICVCHGT